MTSLALTSLPEHLIYFVNASKVLIYYFFSKSIFGGRVFLQNPGALCAFLCFHKKRKPQAGLPLPLEQSTTFL